MNIVIHHLLRAIECNPEFSDAHIILAREYKKDADLLHYKKHLKKAIYIDKQVILNSAKQQENYADQNLFGLVRKMFFRELEQKRHLSNLLIEMGIFHFDKKEYNKAHQFFSDAESLDPLNGDVYNHIALVQLKNKKYKKAHQYFIQCIERDIHHLSANIELGKFYQRKKDYNSAEVHFFCALENNPYDPSVHILIGKLYLVMQNPEAAKHHYETAVSLDASCEDRKLASQINI